MTFVYGLMMFLAFIIMVLVHEFGHYTMAKLLKIPVTEFAVGFGPVIVKKKVKETTYSLRCIPLGGFCSFAKDDGIDKTMQEAVADDILYNQSPIKRFPVLIAGACMNIITGFIAAIIFYGNISTAWESTVLMFQMIGESFWMLLHGQFGMGDFMSIIGIVAMVAEWMNENVRILFVMFIYMSYYMAVFNLLPIPALDGGSAITTLIEIIARREIPFFKKYGLYVKLTFLFALLLFGGILMIVDIFKTWIL